MVTTRLTHLRRGAIAATVFLAGAVFASGMNWTRRADAQSIAPSHTPALATPAAGAPADFSTVAARITPAVVSVRAEHDARPATSRQRDEQPAIPPELQQFFQFQQPQGQGAPRMFSLPDPQQQDRTAGGSGFIVTQDGYVLTNDHVVDGADRVVVGLPDRREFKARVVGRDPQTDVAVLKIDGTNLPTIPLGDDSQARVGEWVLAVGNPLQLDFTVTAGIISAKGRANELRGLNTNKYAIQDFIQTDAAINFGNSGGALIDTTGALVGINTAIVAKNLGVEGIGFAIPVNLVRGVLNDIVAHGRVIRGWIGIVPEDVSDAQAAQLGLAHGGVLISNLYVGSPAQQAGLQPGDLLIAIDGAPLKSAQEAIASIAARHPGTTLTLRCQRGRQSLDVHARVTEPPINR